MVAAAACTGSASGAGRNRTGARPGPAGCATGPQAGRHRQAAARLACAARSASWPSMRCSSDSMMGRCWGVIRSSPCTTIFTNVAARSDTLCGDGRCVCVCGGGVGRLWCAAGGRGGRWRFTGAAMADKMPEWRCGNCDVGSRPLLARHACLGVRCGWRKRWQPTQGAVRNQSSNIRTTLPALTTLHRTQPTSSASSCGSERSSGSGSAANMALCLGSASAPGPLPLPLGPASAPAPLGPASLPLPPGAAAAAAEGPIPAAALLPPGPLPPAGSACCCCCACCGALCGAAACASSVCIAVAPPACSAGGPAAAGAAGASAPEGPAPAATAGWEPSGGACACAAAAPSAALASRSARSAASAAACLRRSPRWYSSSSKGRSSELSSCVQGRAACVSVRVHG